MTNKELGKEIEGYLNGNSKGLIYSFTGELDQGDGAGRALLLYLVHYRQRHAEITIEFLMADFQRAGAGGQRYHLNLFSSGPGLNDAVSGWITEDLERIGKLF